MDCLRISGIFLMLACLVFVTACSKSTQEGAEPDTRPTMTQFFKSKSEPPGGDFSSESVANSILLANRASLSFFKFKVNAAEAHTALMTPWPMFSTLALADAASHGDTAEQLNDGLNQFALNTSWAQAYQALLQSQASLLASSTGFIRQDLWAQFDSHFELEFLREIDPLYQATFHATDFKSAEDIHPVVENLALQTSGENYSFYLENYANTRLFMLNQIRLNGNFDLNSLELERFEGLFENEASELIRAPMLRVKGNLGYYDNNEFSAYRIPLSSNKLSLIFIQPKTAMHDYIANNLDSILASLYGSWVSQETQAVLPILYTESRDSGTWMSDWLGTSLLYSEESADLRNMDRHGGLYLQGLRWHHVLAISSQGIAVSGISAHAATYSALNMNIPDYGNPIGVVVTIGDGANYNICSDAVPDLTTGILLIADTETGLLHSALQLKELKGVLEGQRTNCIQVNGPPS